MKKYVVKRAFLEAACQYNVERDKPAFVGVNCLDLENDANTMHFIHDEILNEINLKVGRQCALIDMTTEVDSCGSTAPAAIDCLLANASQCVDALFSANFPPLP